MAPKLDDLAKIPTKQKVLLAVLFSAIVIVGYYYLYYREASVQIDTLEAS